MYVMAAVLLPRRVHEPTRRDVRKIAGPTSWWHTVDRQQSSQGRHDVETMIGYLARFRDACIVTVCVRPTQADTGIRRASLTALLRELGKSAPAPGVPGPVQLIVFEKQREQSDTDRDRHTIKQARRAGHIGRTVQTQWISPSAENLLWLPDLVSNTYYRYATRGDPLVQQLQAQFTTVTVPLDASDPLAAVARAQGVSLPFR